jgi:hypothetical protein
VLDPYVGPVAPAARNRRRAYGADDHDLTRLEGRELREWVRGSRVQKGDPGPGTGEERGQNGHEPPRGGDEISPRQSTQRNHEGRHDGRGDQGRHDCARDDAGRERDRPQVQPNRLPEVENRSGGAAHLDRREGFDLLQRRRAYPLDLLKLLHRPERPVRPPVLHDGLGSRRSDLG